MRVTWWPGGRQHAYAAPAPPATRSAAVSAASAAARAASQVPGPISVIVSKQCAPVRAQVAAGSSGSRPFIRPGSGKM